MQKSGSTPVVSFLQKRVEIRGSVDNRHNAGRMAFEFRLRGTSLQKGKEIKDSRLGKEARTREK